VSFSNQIANRITVGSNRIFTAQIELPEAIQSRFKSNRDLDLPTTAGLFNQLITWSIELLHVQINTKYLWYRLFIHCIYHAATRLYRYQVSNAYRRNVDTTKKLDLKLSWSACNLPLIFGCILKNFNLTFTYVPLPHILWSEALYFCSVCPCLYVTHC